MKSESLSFRDADKETMQKAIELTFGQLPHLLKSFGVLMKFNHEAQNASLFYRGKVIGTMPIDSEESRQEAYLYFLGIHDGMFCKTVRD